MTADLNIKQYLGRMDEVDYASQALLLKLQQQPPQGEKLRSLLASLAEPISNIVILRRQTRQVIQVVGIAALLLSLVPTIIAGAQDNTGCKLEITRPSSLDPVTIELSPAECQQLEAYISAVLGANTLHAPNTGEIEPDMAEEAATEQTESTYEAPTHFVLPVEHILPNEDGELDIELSQFTRKTILIIPLSPSSITWLQIRSTYIALNYEADDYGNLAPINAMADVIDLTGNSVFRITVGQEDFLIVLNNWWEAGDPTTEQVTAVRSLVENIAAEAANTNPRRSVSGGALDTRQAGNTGLFDSLSASISTGTLAPGEMPQLVVAGS